MSRNKIILSSFALLLVSWSLTATAEDAAEKQGRGLLSSALMSDQFAEDTALDVRGWISGGANWNTTNSSDSIYNGPVTFDDHADTGQLDQIYLIAERKVTYGADDFSLGGRIDAMYGADASFAESFGFDDEFTGKGLNSRRNVAIPQAYVEANLPVGNGLSIKAGHFYTLLGYEVVPAPDNFFYTHSYSMQYGEPVTHWGALATYTVSDALTVSGGAVRGWDNLSDTTDGNMSFLGGSTWKASDDTTVAFSIISGNQGHDQNLTAYSLVGTHLINDRWAYVMQHDLGAYDAEDGRHDWYSLAQYLTYKVDEATKLGVRFEWFNDADGARVTGLHSGNILQKSDYFGLTFGANTQLCKYLMFRPEIRYDWQTGADAGKWAFDKGRDRDQLLVSANLILSF